ncbi:mandelate racemase/muconate lactonizing enzyme family protein [Flavimaricola marinus]|uniref:L-Ala-D/L-Glu epimerase n=1 Tax=Flavimaricola marinus TaxID=1819565 RepID=A0A238LMD4_9RHOB|nr:enolase C-terminal domain-like protein [Flavimaricola marinus]SMY10000.1 L-Ala-D/L-Glu epimerase [Flavimaricola marinus]
MGAQRKSSTSRGLTITDWRLTRFQVRRDRVIGDSQVAFDAFHAVALELTDGSGRTGLGFAHTMWDPMPPLAVMEATFAAHVWPGLDGMVPAALVHRIERPRGGAQRDATYGFGEAMQIALWDLAAQQAGLPLSEYLGGSKRSAPVYASGLDFHLSDAEFTSFFARASSLGFSAFKIKLGHAEAAWDLNRLDLLRDVVGPDATVMVDANEGWSPKDASHRLELFRKAGHDIYWVEDPILRTDIEGLKALSAAHPWTLINSGEYLDVSGRARLLMARATDIINVHGRISEVMHIGWLAAELGIPVALGNTTLETGVHAACALPEVPWLEYSFQNYDFLVDEPFGIQEGRIHVPDRPGLGLTLSETARRDWAAPEVLSSEEMRRAPDCRMFQKLSA